MPGEIETYGGQPNKQAADMVTTFDPGRMIWNGYTGAAGWMFRQALEGVLGLRLVAGRVVAPADLEPAGELGPVRVARDLVEEPAAGPGRAAERPRRRSRPNRQPVQADDHGTSTMRGHSRWEPISSQVRRSGGRGRSIVNAVAFASRVLPRSWRAA